MHPLLWITLLLLALTALSLRWIPTGHCLVVVRRGTVRRVAERGVTLVDPLRDHATLLDLGPQEAPMVVHAVTADDHEVVVLARLEYTISDPVVAARTVVSADATSVDVAEELTAAFVAARELAAVSPFTPEVLDRLVTSINLRCALWGVRAESVRIDEVDVRLVTP